MEEILSQILSEIRNMSDKMDCLDKRLYNLDIKINALENRTDNINNRIDNLEKTISQIKPQENENTEILKALMHSSQIQKAQIDNIEHKIAAVSGDIAGIKRDLSLIEIITSKNSSEMIDLNKEIKIIKDLKDSIQLPSKLQSSEKIILNN